MNTIRRAILAGVLLAIPVLSPAADRPLAEGPGYTITHTTAGGCGRTADVTIISSDIALFSGRSADLQNALDAARAMLEFQCPRVDAITVTGELHGMYTPVYQGRATRDGDWLLETERSIETVSEPWEGGAPEVDRQPYSVANLKAGMPLETARRVTLETFGRAPRYDAKNRVMTLNLNGCPADIDRARRRVQPDWKCLRAWFSEGTRPVLERLELVQVIADAEVAGVQTTLESHFGAADSREVGSDERRWQRDAPQWANLRWSAHGGGDPTLAARLDRKGKHVVVHITLARDRDAPGLAGGGFSNPGLIL